MERETIRSADAAGALLPLADDGRTGTGTGSAPGKASITSRGSTASGIPAALTHANGAFLRAGRPHRVLSGSLHYFRVHPEQWADRLRRVAALGLNTVDTYVPWNFHERTRGTSASTARATWSGSSAWPGGSGWT